MKTQEVVRDIATANRDIASFMEELNKVRNDGTIKASEYQKIHEAIKEVELNNERKITAGVQSFRIEIHKLLDDKIHDIEYSINNKIMTRIELIEKNMDALNKQSQALDEKFNIENDKNNKIEEAMKANFNVITQLNEKVNRHTNLFDSTK